MHKWRRRRIVAVRGAAASDSDTECKRQQVLNNVRQELVFAGILAGVRSGILVGLINGTLTTTIGIPSFLTTLAVMGVARGVAAVASRQERPLNSHVVVVSDKDKADGNR